MIRHACPDIAAHARHGISGWPQLVATATMVWPMLEISPSAWVDALATVGPVEAAIVVAAILQRSESISSAGGYLRSLPEKARAGTFSIGPTLMALLRTKLREDVPGRAMVGAAAAGGSLVHG